MTVGFTVTSGGYGIGSAVAKLARQDARRIYEMLGKIWKIERGYEMLQVCSTWLQFFLRMNNSGVLVDVFGDLKTVP